MNQIETLFNLQFDGISNSRHPFIFTIALSDKESYRMKEMLLQPDAKDIISAMLDEIKAH